MVLAKSGMTYEQAVTNKAIKHQSREIDCTKTNP